MMSERTDRVRTIADAIDEALYNIEVEYDVTIERDGSIKYSDNDFSMKLRVNEASNDDPEALYNQQVAQKGLTEEAPEYGTEFEMSNKKYRVVGFKPNARKNNIVVKQLSNQKEYVTSIHQIDICLGKIGLTLEEPPSKFA